MITAGTYKKVPHLNSTQRLDFFLELLFDGAVEFGWQLRAWAVMANHYHFVAASPSNPETLRKFLGKLHMQASKHLNIWDGTPGRRVWFQFWDSHITFQPSYFARLNYVHYNPVHHRVIGNAENYQWCSAAWFANNASDAFVTTIKNFKIDRLKVRDDF